MRCWRRASRGCMMPERTRLEGRGMKGKPAEDAC
jgi:hypothetical protein